MALLDKLKPTYEVGMTCENCGKKCVIKIKKGRTVPEACKGGEIKCDNCSCVFTPTEYTTQWFK